MGNHRTKKCSYMVWKIKESGQNSFQICFLFQKRAQGCMGQDKFLNMFLFLKYFCGIFKPILELIGEHFWNKYFFLPKVPPLAFCWFVPHVFTSGRGYNLKTGISSFHQSFSFCYKTIACTWSCHWLAVGLVCLQPCSLWCCGPTWWCWGLPWSGNCGTPLIATQRSISSCSQECKGLVLVCFNYVCHKGC